MKFARLGEIGNEVPCALDPKGLARDISGIVRDIAPGEIDGMLAKLASADLETLPVVNSDGVRVGAPIARPGSIYCIGLNYSDHAAEAGMAVPEEPILFTKPSNTLCGPNDPIWKSANMQKLDWEVELGVVIGKAALHVPVEKALDHVLGYTIVNDVSERVWQMERGGQWSKGKSFPNFCPTGPWLVTPDEIADPGDLAMSLTVNGDQMQSGSTRTMIFGVAEIISHLSQFMRLDPGDLICTGTPPGVGMGKTPPQYLELGDHVELSIEGLDTQSQTVTQFPD